MVKRCFTQEEAIADIRSVHGDVYDYSKVVYTKSAHRIIVVCPEHGDFVTTHAKMKSGRGCPTCARKRVSESQRKTTAEFIAEARAVHGDKFDYSAAEYLGSKFKMLISCPEHGQFRQSAGDHLKGMGCPACGAMARVAWSRDTTDGFISKARQVHGERYDYAKTDYQCASKPVIITCGKHGDFEQRANHHLSGIGCSKCGKEATAVKLAFSTDEFIEKAKEVHGDKYLYNAVTYKNSQTKVSITCTEHGPWDVVPNSHLMGYGCPRCAEYGFSTSRPGWLYVFECDGLVKVGITNREPEKRCSEVVKSSNKPFEVVFKWLYENGQECLDMETSLLKILRTLYKETSFKFVGSTECFEGVDLPWLLNTITNKEVSLD